MNDFRKTAPAPLAPIPFNLPKPFETELENGLKVVIIEDKRFPLVSLRLAFFKGDANEPKDAVGLNSSVTSMLSEGTENYSSAELAEEIERLGANISASSSDDSTIIAASALSLYTSDVLRLLSEMILRPTFPENELDLYRRNMLESLKYQRSQSSFLANEQTARILYGEHPYANISPTPADIEKLTREKLIDYHAKNFIPNDAIFFAVGNVERDELLAELNDKFGKWEKGTVETKEFPAPPERTERTLTIVDRKGSAQSNIVISSLGINRTHPDNFPVLLMNQILGAGASSRIFMNIREEKGYTYGAYSRFDTKKLAGEFEATAEVRNDVTGASLKEFFYELNRIRDEKVSEEELQDAKSYLTGVFPIRAETQEGLTGLIVAQKLHGLPEDYLQTYHANVNAVTVEDISRVANQYIQPAKVAIIIVGDAEEILEQVRDYSEKIEIFDTEGNPREIEKYMQNETAANANAGGNWDLTIDFQGQKIPVSLKLEQDNEDVNGKLESMLGEGKISGGKVRGTKVSAVAVTEMQGQLLEISISGNIDGDSISGTLSAPVIPVPLEFTGKRQA
ncbi:MAG: insulinase family protein [Pyrinomonadaceae bacterium]|nr:insulinase family protein [Pyrinomonadaceae bacterium]